MINSVSSVASHYAANQAHSTTTSPPAQQQKKAEATGDSVQLSQAAKAAAHDTGHGGNCH